MSRQSCAVSGSLLCVPCSFASRGQDPKTERKRVRGGPCTHRDAAEAAAVAVGVLELERDCREAVEELAVVVVVEAEPAARAVGAVQARALLALRHAVVGVHIDVVQAESLAAELLEDRHDQRVRHRVAVGLVPVQHARVGVLKKRDQHKTTIDHQIPIIKIIQKLNY